MAFPNFPGTAGTEFNGYTNDQGTWGAYRSTSSSNVGANNLLQLDGAGAVRISPIHPASGGVGATSLALVSAVTPAEDISGRFQLSTGALPNRFVRLILRAREYSASDYIDLLCFTHTIQLRRGNVRAETPATGIITPGVEFDLRLTYDIVSNVSRAYVNGNLVLTDDSAPLTEDGRPRNMHGFCLSDQKSITNTYINGFRGGPEPGDPGDPEPSIASGWILG